MSSTQIPFTEVYVYRNIRLPKCPLTEMSVYRNIRLQKYPLTEMSAYRFVCLPKCPVSVRYRIVRYQNVRHSLYSGGDKRIGGHLRQHHLLEVVECLFADHDDAKLDA